jgi:hypothetical protein
MVSVSVSVSFWPKYATWKYTPVRKIKMIDGLHLCL